MRWRELPRPLLASAASPASLHHLDPGANLNNTVIILIRTWITSRTIDEHLFNEARCWACLPSPPLLQLPHFAPYKQLTKTSFCFCLLDKLYFCFRLFSHFVLLLQNNTTFMCAAFMRTNW